MQPPSSLTATKSRSEYFSRKYLHQDFSSKTIYFISSGIFQQIEKADMSPVSERELIKIAHLPPHSAPPSKKKRISGVLTVKKG